VPGRLRRLAEIECRASYGEEDRMSAVLLAMFDKYEIAERVRVELVRDGFPTDRVELTASCEPGRAGLGPADSPHERFVQYFRELFTLEEERHHPEQLARHLDTGAVTITVHPRGSMETARAKQILSDAGPVELISHDLPNQTTQCRGSKVSRPWIIAPATLCLLFAAYVVNEQESSGAGASELSLQQTESVPDETRLPPEGHTSRYISAVITHYFDTYLAELPLERLGTGYTLLADHDPDWWVLENETTGNIASCRGLRR
jgi:hypothetical protein